MPTLLAARKCPASWMRTSSSRPAMARKTATPSDGSGESGSDGRPREGGEHDRARRGVRLVDLGARLQRLGRQRLERLLDQPGDVEEAAAPREEGGDTLLVGRFQPRRRGAPRLARGTGQRQAAEGLQVGVLEG